jgi:hypothetical protein
MIVEYVDNNSPSLRVYLQKTSLKKKVKQVKEQKLGSKIDLQKVKVKHVEEQKLGSKVDLQNMKVEYVEEQKLGSKVDLQNVKVEHVEEGSTLDIQVEIKDWIYNQRFQKYLNYHWIQKSIVQNVASRNFKEARD